MDVFYFNSPSSPALLLGERSLKWRGKPSAKRRKICSAMDATLYHAHAVRVAEPTIVANDLSSLPSDYLGALLDAGHLPSSPSSPPVPHNVQPLHRSSTPKSDEGFVNHEPSAVNDVPAPLADRAGAQDPAADHPRPESADLWEEEDSRRIRFALPDENDDHVERLRNSYNTRNRPYQAEGPFHPPVQQHPEDNEEESALGLLPMTTPPLSLLLPPHLAGGLFSEQFAFPLPPPPSLLHRSSSQLLSEDTVLSVDDHRRNYDFADFMDQWRSKASQNNDIPSFNPATGPSLWRRPRRDYFRPSGSTAIEPIKRDLQGLGWEPFGVERSSALKTRRLLHPQGGDGDAVNYTVSTHNDELHYRPRAFAPNHRAHFSHYQLRNMTAASKGRDIYYAAGSQVQKTSLACPSVKQMVMDLAKPSRSASPFKVTCLASSTSNRGQEDDVLIAGGFNGEYAILALNSTVSSKPAEGIVSHATDGIVNHISTSRSRQSGDLQAAFCSNDHNVRIMDLRRQSFTNTFDYGSPINCSAMSPDGRLRALVHDGADSWITGAETGEILVRLEAHIDFAFACDWSPCGRYVATGAEDRQVIIWDARNWSRPLHKLACVMFCARSLRFTDDGALVIAESEDVVSIVDTARPALRQDIRFFGALAGMTLLDGGAEMVVANADATVGGLMSFSRVTSGRGSGAFGIREGREKCRRIDRVGIVEEVVI